jgi:hypothetical protein
MRKGVRAAQNVNLLRWAGYYGIDVAWNIIWGFPGETAQDYAEQADVIPHLVHLRPPAGAARLWIERFSPLYQQTPAPTPDPGYRSVYPKTVDLAQAAYFFEYDLPGALPDDAYTGVSDAVAAWSAAWARDPKPTLRYWSSPGFLQIHDARHPETEGTYTFEGVLADIYLACSDRPIGASAVRDRLDGRVPVELVQEAFDEFARRGLMFLDDTLALSLALPAGPTR